MLQPPNDENIYFHSYLIVPHAVVILVILIKSLCQHYQNIEEKKKKNLIHKQKKVQNLLKVLELEERIHRIQQLVEKENLGEENEENTGGSHKSTKNLFTIHEEFVYKKTLTVDGKILYVGERYVEEAEEE